MYGTSTKKNAPPRIDTVDELVAKSVFDKEFTKLKAELETQQSVTWGVVIGVAIAFVFAVGVVVADAIISRNTYIDQTTALAKEIGAQSAHLNDLKNDLQNLKIRNSFLK